MRVFVAGASGVVGRRLVSLLVERGHEVVGMASREERAGPVRELGAEAVVCDALDAESLRAAVAAARPEVVVHALSRLPANVSPRTIERDFAAHDRLRSEGTLNLVDAARGAGARRLVAHSVALVYAHEGDAVKSEDAPLWLGAPHPYRRTVEAVVALERAVTEAGDLEGVVLRNGHFYGPGTAHARDGSMAEAVRARRFPIVGRGDGIYSFVHVDDVAAATAIAIGDGPEGIYNVVDDDPAPVREWLPAYCEAVGAPKPRRVPRLVARAVAGELGVAFVTAQRGASNARIRKALGWQPGWPSWRTGFAEGNG